MKELIEIQRELKVPKNQFNKFGGYNYRSCEDILEAVKPLLYQYKVTLTVSDEIVMCGNWIFLKATVTLRSETETVTTVALARHAEVKKGMDDSQITGSASSYARKYAINGMFCIDDCKDADGTNQHGQESPPSTPQSRATPSRTQTPLTQQNRQQTPQSRQMPQGQTNQASAPSQGQQVTGMMVYDFLKSIGADISVVESAYNKPMAELNKNEVAQIRKALSNAKATQRSFENCFFELLNPNAQSESSQNAVHQ